MDSNHITRDERRLVELTLQDLQRKDLGRIIQVSGPVTFDGQAVDIALSPFGHQNYWTRVHPDANAYLRGDDTSAAVFYHIERPAPLGHSRQELAQPRQSLDRQRMYVHTTSTPIFLQQDGKRTSGKDRRIPANARDLGYDSYDEFIADYPDFENA